MSAAMDDIFIPVPTDRTLEALYQRRDALGLSHVTDEDVSSLAFEFFEHAQGDSSIGFLEGCSQTLDLAPEVIRPALRRETSQDAPLADRMLFMLEQARAAAPAATQTAADASVGPLAKTARYGILRRLFSRSAHSAR